jgi:hypothetical protein
MIGWDTFRLIAAALCALFALALIGLPLMRVAARRLRFSDVWGFLLAGLGFAMLAVGLLLLPDPRAQTLIIAAVIATVIGRMAQQRDVRSRPDENLR